MKLLNLNVSIKLDNNEKVVSLLKNIDSDIMTLQEVTRAIGDNVFDRYNNSKIIKDQLKKYQYSFFGALWCAERHIKNGVISKDFGGMIEQGNEVISKYPIVEAENIFFYKDYAIFEDVTNFRKTDHPRALERVILNIENSQVQIINIHGIWNEGKKGNEQTIKQCQFVLEEALKRNLPTIITGDFNLNLSTESIRIINEKFINLIDVYGIKTTRPIVNDGLDIGNSVDDYIFVNDMIKVNNFEVLESDVSDHYPLILDFDIINK